MSNFLFFDQFLKITFLDDRDPGWIAFASGFGGISPVGNIRNLGRRKGDDLVVNDYCGKIRGSYENRARQRRGWLHDSWDGLPHPAASL